MIQFEHKMVKLSKNFQNYDRAGWEYKFIGKTRN